MFSLMLDNLSVMPTLLICVNCIIKNDTNGISIPSSTYLLLGSMLSVTMNQQKRTLYSYMLRQSISIMSMLPCVNLNIYLQQ